MQICFCNSNLSLLDFAFRWGNGSHWHRDRSAYSGDHPDLFQRLYHASHRSPPQYCPQLWQSSGTGHGSGQCAYPIIVFSTKFRFFFLRHGNSLDNGCSFNLGNFSERETFCSRFLHRTFRIINQWPMGARCSHPHKVILLTQFTVYYGI